MSALVSGADEEEDNSRDWMQIYVDNHVCRRRGHNNSVPLFESMDAVEGAKTDALLTREMPT